MRLIWTGVTHLCSQFSWPLCPFRRLEYLNQPDGLTGRYSCKKLEKVLIDEFNEIIDTWISALETYTLEELCLQPFSGHWSAGQLYLHLLNDTNYYIEQIRESLAGNHNEKEIMAATARPLFLANDFPDELIAGNPANAFIPQPGSSDALKHAFEKLKEGMNGVAVLMATTVSRAKAKHPGFNYLNADEWLQLAVMHFRHHLRQKKRIDLFLKTCPRL